MGLCADQIGSGQSQWIALAPKLAPRSDAGFAEDLGISLAFALPQNPKAVLAAIDPRDDDIIKTTRVCGIPFIEDTVKDIPAYQRKAISAVSSLPKNYYRDKRLKYLRMLDS